LLTAPNGALIHQNYCYPFAKFSLPSEENNALIMVITYLDA